MEDITKDNICIAILFLGSVLAGFGQAIMWVAQGEYISQCASDENKGFYIGFFWSWYMGSQIFGNLIGAILITDISGPSFFVVMTAIMFVAVACFGLLKMSEPTASKSVEESF